MYYSMGENTDHTGPFTLTALAASGDIHQILNECPKGRVHSVFNSSFNLAFGEHLIHIGALPNGLSPFGIGLSEEIALFLTKLAHASEEVFWDVRSQSIIFPKGLWLSLNQVNWANHKVQPVVYQLSYIKTNAAFVADRLLQDDWQTGLGDNEEEKKQIIHYLLDSSNSHGDSIIFGKLSSLMKLVRNEEDIEAEEVFDYWIGRGLGLTPSGDDVITGICAVLSAFEGIDQTFIGKLKSYLDDRGRKRTTDIALEYLLYATDNKFHSHLQGICSVLNQPMGSELIEALDELKKIGHTSGADTLLGVLVGITSVVIHKKER
ncbi:DUF2877 domain-containing protein [Sporosarcina thermotolerans]|uniref:DUF2877 domain-containing protein n=1 Tax=Sporosarcina thermotolerans TaxID=633404 RepID=A0AAW9AB99_9BACL|nr:DUF2877 domain-containing protein [Sporosarcina thermotolerans]MDW0117878.1 DUF2877 domain-containing protein [Sporosarcina thermotolerans]WHT49319.1 DUF2877 domain-containing protein [Sporosarcina thermotolerans]